MIRAVLDTNVFVSAYLLPVRLNHLPVLFVEKRFVWLISQEIFQEYMGVALRPYYKIFPEQIELLSYQLKERTEWVEVHTRLQIIPEDPTDDKFIACAVDGRAGCIVTGDRHLSRLGAFRGIRILSPEEFLKTLHA